RPWLAESHRLYVPARRYSDFPHRDRRALRGQMLRRGQAAATLYRSRNVQPITAEHPPYGSADGAIGSPPGILTFVILSVRPGPHRIRPILVIEIPAHQRRQGRLERLARTPTELCAQRRRVERISPIMAQSILHMPDQLV